MKRAFVVFIFIFGLCSCPVLAQSSPEAPKKPLTIEAIFTEGGLTGRPPEAMQWSPDGKILSFVQRDDAGEHGQLWYVDAATGEKKVLVSEAKLAGLAPDATKIKDEREKERVLRYHVAAYIWSPDSKCLLFDSQGQLWVYSLENGVAVQLTSSPDASQDPKFSPDGKNVAYLRKHNLYIQPIGILEGRRLTDDSDENILNGEVDWVYAEELSVRSNYFWSPDSKEIVFLQMNEKQVPTYPITDWMPTHPRVEQEKYPKAGDPNPSVRLGLIGVKGGKPKFFTLTKDTDIYIPRFGWVREGVLWAQVLNRAQDTLDLYFIDSKSGHSRKVLTESSPGSWVDVNDVFQVLKSGDRFLWSSWRDGHTHLFLYSFDKQNPLASDAKLERQLEKGDYEVLSVDAVDETSVFFTANQGDPRKQGVFSVKLDGSDFKRLSQPEGWHSAVFPDDAKHWLDRYSNATTPPRWTLCGSSGPCSPVWEARSLADYGLVAPKFLEFKADDGTTLYGELLLPPNPPAGKIPLVVYTYGGPAAQEVTDSWGGTNALFHQLLARKAFAVFTVDNRGTPNRGRAFSTAIFHQYGPIELKDQLAGLNGVLAQDPELDKDRVAIWGWSGGGSMTLYAMTHSEAFKAGVAVAPVTDQRNYDSIYTERYMGLPKDNPKGYDEGAVTKAAAHLHGSLFLVHGTSDDNVHFQNSVQMIDALIKADKPFRLMIYPNKTHGIAGTAARTHLFQLMEEHFERELK
ncbi:MAG TPA: DPP IV N-terminal domain-containing protein [Terriglobales bacterium]|nr:DPP IV N-terminal domain-containing protein [Terriglobales bacterium]